MKLVYLISLLFISSVIKAQDSTFYFTTSDSVKLFVRIAGKGQPCLFLHGGPGSTSYYFEAMPAAKFIEQEYSMIYFDQRGSGRSASPGNGNYSLQRFEKDIEEIRQYLNIKKWTVMGHSFAGVLSTSYAYHHPEAVKAIVLINATLNINYSMNSHLEFGLQECKITDQFEYRDTTRKLIERVGMVHKKLNEKGTWYKLMFKSKEQKMYSDSVTLSIGKFNFDFGNKVWDIKDYFFDFTSITDAIKCPVLVCTGSEDYAIGVDHYKSFRFPNQTVMVFKGGHAPFQEDPQWFSTNVISFLKSVSN